MCYELMIVHFTHMIHYSLCKYLYQLSLFVSFIDYKLIFLIRIN